jgi:hypothetical protein
MPPRRCFDLATSLGAAAFIHARGLLRTQHLIPEAQDDLSAVPDYEYKPLENPRHIRLMAVHKGPPGGLDAPSVDLITISIDSPRPYTALSYTWGYS